MPKFICKSGECEYTWSPQYSTGQDRPETHMLGEICPQCHHIQTPSDDD